MAARVFLLLAPLLGASAQCQSPQWNCSSEFGTFVQHYQKRYKDGSEISFRLAVFTQNARYIYEENTKGTNSYTLGINSFADLSVDELQGTLFGNASPKKVPHGLAYLGPHPMTNNKAQPPSVDWRSKGAVTPVKFQGHYCGSCWAFSTTGSLEGALQIATGKLVALSEQQLVDCDKSDSGCDGGDIDTAFEYVKASGLDTTASYNYSANQSKAGSCKAGSGIVGLSVGSLAGYHDVATDNMQALLDAVVQQPVSVMIEADKKVFQFYKSGVLTSKCGTSLDHSVLVAGYGVDGASNLKYWLVKNSWGAAWGEDGYVRLLRGKNIEGECGILRGASYPVMAHGLTLGSGKIVV